MKYLESRLFAYRASIFPTASRFGSLHFPQSRLFRTSPSRLVAALVLLLLSSCSSDSKNPGAGLGGAAAVGGGAGTDSPSTGGAGSGAPSTGGAGSGVPSTGGATTVGPNECDEEGETLVKQECFTQAQGFSEGVSIDGIHGWSTGENASDWVAQDVLGSGYSMNASNAQSRAVFELGETWSDTENDAFNLSVKFSVPSAKYSDRTELFSVALFPTSSGASTGFGTGVRVYWDGGRFVLRGRNGGSTGPYRDLPHIASGIEQATLYLRVEKNSSPGQLRVLYSFSPDFVYHRAETMESSGVYGDTDGLFLQMQSENAAANGGDGIRVHTIKVEKNLEWFDPYERPFIWSRRADRQGILHKIETRDWAAQKYEAIKKFADDAVKAHGADREAFLRLLPLETAAGEPRFTQETHTNYDDELQQKFTEGVRCAAMFYLTEDESYARVAADIFHNTIQGLVNVTPLEGNTAGWIYGNGLLGEAEQTAHRIPIMYDYLHSYLKTSPKVFELRKAGGKEVEFSPASFADAQSVFRKYHELITTRGLADNNWSPNMARTLVPAVLALDDPAERADKLKDYLTRDHARQTSLKRDAELRYPKPGDIWPESMYYSMSVNNLHPMLMVMVDRYDPSLNTFGTYPNVPMAMPLPFLLNFPNNQILHFGDSQRPIEPQPYDHYESVYGHAKKNNISELTDIYGSLIQAGVASGDYSRGEDKQQAWYKSLLPRTLFWAADDIPETAAGLVPPRTDTLSHSGTVLQRNISTTGDINDDLMCVVGGGAHIHSHADGMSISLYGQGAVLGVDAGKGDYKTPLHENYYRVFAGHNTIIVNGASRGEGGWVGTAINTVQMVAMEPARGEEALSPDISYSCTTFEDDKGNGAEASQQRTLALIRTSPTTGYYVDLYRSDSRLPGEYHDYLYHNLGELLEVEKANGTPLSLKSEPNRFQNDIGDKYKQPGWRYFEDVYNGASTETIRARFTADVVPGDTVYMDLHIPGESDREYSKVMAPPTMRQGREYQNQRTPTLVVRKTGEAWERPFTVVYEPHRGGKNGGSVQSVEKLITYGTVYGVKVVSKVKGKTITQYVLSNPDPSDARGNSALGFELAGRFAVITDNGDGSGSLYMGDGSSLTFGKRVLRAKSGRVDAVMEFSPGKSPLYRSNGELAK